MSGLCNCRYRVEVIINSTLLIFYCRCLKEDRSYHFINRGKVFVKGLGLRTTFFVEANQNSPNDHVNKQQIQSNADLGSPVDVPAHHVQARSCAPSGKHHSVSWTAPSFSSHIGSLVCDQMPIASSWQCILLHLVQKCCIMNVIYFKCVLILNADFSSKVIFPSPLYDKIRCFIYVVHDWHFWTDWHSQCEHKLITTSIVWNLKS